MHAPIILPLLHLSGWSLAYATCQLALLVAIGLRAVAGGHFSFSFGGRTAVKASFLPPSGRCSLFSTQHYRAA
ncbi:hypothetical protein H8B13_02355 [Hymenobacter sp. BT188]|uniref:hypothetical protein n=1 Tax=Hymenobacter sp. BT188 TaxID=2763504 RepID=UPI0016510AA4|nr:hypothetical protein [Hymenobacter sp. BT188]MBC6605651.1 hypothetical protein [Hymenobacter sp. BT188]